jgi:hypothetical protein
MMYIIDLSEKEHVFHVGDKLPNLDPANVVEIQVDGHELEYIAPILEAFGLDCSERVINIYDDAAIRVFTWMQKAKS